MFFKTKHTSMHKCAVINLFLFLSIACTPINYSSMHQIENYFTYTTYNGQILQVSISGRKRQLFSADKKQKEYLKWSPNRGQLAYLTSDILDGHLQKTLWVVSHDGRSVRPIFGPVKGLRYEWEDNQIIYVEEAVSFERIPFDKDTIIQASVIDVVKTTSQEIKRKTELFPLPVNSPNGQRAVWTDPTDDKWTLYLLDSKYNKILKIYIPPHGHYASGYWSPNSEHLAIIRPDITNKGVYLYEINSKSWLKLFTLSETYLFSNLKWSPNGKMLSYLLHNNANLRQICVFYLEHRDEQCFDVQYISNEYIWSHDSRYIAYLSRTLTGETDIFAIDTEGEKVINLTDDGNTLIEQNVNW